ncbi:uncharacterized protein C8Q71DRAFT_777284 [Rhodofomes roseus]|uniref:MYND-type domain-containing protein n=1 Tax=Rhodofomes roseus TaxID=34475 RepID=A0ABQ8K6U2_9APHY|nr:uncharacterized protein C8Q71DRAFT_777284 [Rhodofomes roseus]KAH9832607.1 hypothetical protein C8Q71DRAFT_777284 [Rhodofomes roseus]
MDPSIPSDSHQARHGIQECNFCLKSRSEVGRLFACSGCKLALYCSPECQKAGWSFHKHVCKSIKDERSQLKEMDKLFLSASDKPQASAAVSSGAALPSVIMDEFCAFAEKFKLPLMEAGYNGLNIASDPSFSGRAVLFVLLEHAPDRAQSSRVWARFKVVHARPMTYDELRAEYGRENVQGLIDQFIWIRDLQSRVDDYVASETILLSCYCNVTSPPMPLHYPVPIGVTPAYMRAVSVSNTWEQKLKDIVEKISGRNTRDGR